MNRPELILASASPRRAELLRGLGLEFRVVPSGADEDLVAGELPGDHAARLAEAKVRQVAAQVGDADAVVLGADTLVTLGDRIFGKPADDAEAKDMLRFLSGRDHMVITAVFALRVPGGRSAGAVGSTRVRFRSLHDRLVDWYVATGEPMDKAGSYSIQGLGALLSERIEGSWSNVVGLPIELLPALFRKLDADLLAWLPGMREVQAQKT